MTSTDRHALATRFLALHHGPDILVLPNAWDAVTARIFQRAGAIGIGTTSGGIAAALGLPDGERVSPDAMLTVVERIVRSVTVPVTADIEGGYANTPNGVATTIRDVLETGAVGVNLEDAHHHDTSRLVDIGLHVAKIHAARDAADDVGVPLVINARTDVFLAKVGNESDRLSHAVRRANAYLDAGANSAFVPGVSDADDIAALVRQINGPLNILAVQGSPTIAELHELGVARLSVGSGPARATFSLVRRIAEQLLGEGVYDAFCDDQFSQSEIATILATTADS